MEGGWLGEGEQGTKEEQTDIVYDGNMEDLGVQGGPGGWVTRIAWILDNASCLQGGALVRWLVCGGVGAWFLLRLPDVLPRIIPSGSSLLLCRRSHRPCL